MIKTIMRLLVLVSVFVFCFCALPDSRYPSLKGLHKTVIFDQTMTEEDIAVTKQVMHAWECSTNNRIQFTYIQYPSEQELADITDLDHSVIIKNVETDDPRIHDRNGSMPPGTYTVAIYEAHRSQIPDILVAKAFISTNHEYGLYVEHELGHSFGLGHIENTLEPMIPIMDPIPSRSFGITNEDLLALAEHYGIPLEPRHVCQ